MERYFIIKEEARPMGAAQIMIGLINSALGTLWMFLYLLEDEGVSVGAVLMLLPVFYLFVSGAFFINSGSSSIIHGAATTCQVILAIVTNTLSIFICIFGIILSAIELPAFEARGTEYIWSNMAGMMLLQIFTLYTISELVIAIIMVDWFRKAFRHELFMKESPQSSRLSLTESRTPPEMERYSESKRQKERKNKN